MGAIDERVRHGLVLDTTLRLQSGAQGVDRIDETVYQFQHVFVPNRFGLMLNLLVPLK